MPQSQLRQRVQPGVSCMLIRSLWYLSILVAAAAGPLWALLIVGVPYMLRYAGVELLLIALLVDSYFGFERTEWPLYTVATLVCIVLVRLLRPYITVSIR